MATPNTTLPATMRALLQPSPLSTALTLTQIPLPTPTATEHLIKIHTTALTNNELHWAHLFPSIPVSPTKQAIPCYDMCGTIITAVSGSKFQIGDEVWARTDYYRSGTAAEYTVAPEKELALRCKAEVMGWEESATVPMSALTAWQALFVQAGLKAEAGVGAKGKRVFVTAASGAVGRWVVQLAHWAGATVVGTASGDNVEVVKKLGAEEVLDYRTVSIEEWSKGNREKKAEVVIDTIGGKSLADAWFAVKAGGVVVSVNALPEDARPKEGVEEGAKGWFFVMEANGAQMEKITELINGGGFVGSLDSVWALEDAEAAVQKLESGKAKGKVVFDLRLRK